MSPSQVSAPKVRGAAALRSQESNRAAASARPRAVLVWCRARAANKYTGAVRARQGGP